MLCICFLTPTKLGHSSIPPFWWMLFGGTGSPTPSLSTALSIKKSVEYSEKHVVSRDHWSSLMTCCIREDIHWAPFTLTKGSGRRRGPCAIGRKFKPSSIFPNIALCLWTLLLLSHSLKGIIRKQAAVMIPFIESRMHSRMKWPAEHKQFLCKQICLCRWKRINSEDPEGSRDPEALV